MGRAVIVATAGVADATATVETVKVAEELPAVTVTLGGTLAIRGLPLFSEIPIIGYFFGSRGTRSQHNENVIFIVPTLVNAVSLEQRDRVAEAFKVYRNYEGDSDEERDFRKLGQDGPIRPPAAKPESPGVR